MTNPCPECQSPQSQGSLVCGECGTLIWRDRLAALYAASRDAETKHEYQTALSALAECATLLPPETTQHRKIQTEMQRVTHLYASQPPELNQASLVSPEIDGLQNARGGNFIRGATKSMIRGLTRPSTLISLGISIACLSLLTGWKFAVVMCLLVYVHEMGHLLAIQYYGFRFAWPIFVPFLGAFVLHGKASEDRRQNIVIAAAGPLAGSLASAALFAAMEWMTVPPKWLWGCAYFNLALNLANLLPVWILDGGRVARQLTRRQLTATIVALAVCGALAAYALGMYYGLALLGMSFGWVAGALPLWDTARGVAARPGRTEVPTALVIVLMVALTCACVHFRPHKGISTFVKSGRQDSERAQ